jgi:plastocyanin
MPSASTRARWDLARRHGGGGQRRHQHRKKRRADREVGPGYTIEVKRAGKDLKTIRAGTYKIKVEDKASIHDFHLVGPGLNKTTSVPFVGTKTWTIMLEPGKYLYKCDPHAIAGMKGTFRVTA